MFTCPVPTTGGNLLGSCVLSCCLIRSSCQHLPVPSSPPSPPLPASTSPAHTIQWTNCHWPLCLSQLCIYVLFFYFISALFLFVFLSLPFASSLNALTINATDTCSPFHCIMCRLSVWGPESNGFVVTGVGVYLQTDTMCRICTPRWHGQMKPRWSILTICLTCTSPHCCSHPWWWVTNTQLLLPVCVRFSCSLLPGPCSPGGWVHCPE